MSICKTCPAWTLFFCPLAAALSGCFLFGGTAPRSGSALPAEAIDTPEAYLRHLNAHPGDENAGRYQQRLTQLEFVQARASLRPVFAPDARFADQAGGEAVASLGQDTRMIFDSQQEDWAGYRVVEIAPSLEQPVRLFAREGSPVALSISRDDGGVYFSINEPLGIPLVSASSFDARIQQRGTFGSGGMGGGMQFCFFSSAPGSCDDGYEFSYDRAHFQKYQLARKSGGQSTTLCHYQMDTTNTQHSDSITVDMSSGTGRLRDPDIEIHAHNGYLRVSFNGRQICQVQDKTFTEGYFTLAGTPAIAGMSIELNEGSSPVFAPVSALADIQAGEQPLPTRSDAGAEEYNRFAADYNAYLAVKAGGEFPEAFHHDYFNLFFGKAEADEAFRAIEGSKNIDDYLAYLQEFPMNAHRRKIEQTLYRLASEANTAEGYEKFLQAFPNTEHRLPVKRAMADLQWNAAVRKPTKKSLEKYLSDYPNGYHARRAELLLQGLEYYAQHKDEVDEARKVITQAQALVEKSPVTAPWDVAIIDYQHGTVYFNLNNGPVLSRESTTSALYFVTHDQADAHNATCELLDNHIPTVDFCEMLFSKDHVNAFAPFPESEAVVDALRKFYVSRLERGETVNVTRLLELLDRVAQEKGMTFPEHRSVAQAYARLGLSNEAIYAIYTFAASKQKRADVSYLAKGVLEISPDLARDADFQWVVKRYGE